MTPLEQAFAGARTATPAENLSPQEEFAHKLADMGLDLKGRLPELDGKIHRVPLLSKNGQAWTEAIASTATAFPPAGRKTTLPARR